MDKIRNEISEYRGRINEYYKSLGDQMNFTYNRLNKIEAKISAILEEVNNIKETANVDREEFQDTIHTLVESMKGLVVLSQNPYASREYERISRSDDDEVSESSPSKG